MWTRNLGHARMGHFIEKRHRLDAHTVCTEPRRCAQRNPREVLGTLARPYGPHAVAEHVGHGVEVTGRDTPGGQRDVRKSIAQGDGCGHEMTTGFQNDTGIEEPVCTVGTGFGVFTPSTVSVLRMARRTSRSVARASTARVNADNG